MGGRFWRVLLSDESDALVLGERGCIERIDARVVRDVIVDEDPEVDDEGGGISCDSRDSLVLSDATR